MKGSSVVIAILILLVCVVVGSLAFRYLMVPKKYTGPPAQVTIGTSPFEVSGLIWIAESQGFFSENGLNVAIKDYEAGKYAAMALLDGDVDVATASEFVLVGKTMKEKDLQTIGCIAKSEFHYIIGRKDRGIEQISDLKGKRIGLPLQTSPEFYLGRYLQLRGISRDDITIVDLKPTQVEEAVTKGDVDAVVIWDPYAYPIEKGLGRNAVIWPTQGGQMMYWLLIAKREYVAGHPDVIDRLLNSLNQAEQFAVSNSDIAKKIVRNRLHTEEAYAGRIWLGTRLALSLDQGLIIAMEDESRWLMDSNIISKREMPYYPDYIYWQGLKKVRPSAVTITH